jgi:hypothetical protein
MYNPMSVRVTIVTVVTLIKVTKAAEVEVVLVRERLLKIDLDLQ